MERAPWTEPAQVAQSRCCSQLGLNRNGSLADVFLHPNSSEDCLYLDIYRPAGLLHNNSLPVLVWLHGGAFIFGGAGEYGATYWLAERDLVLVTVRYRLGPLGFLTLGTEELPGNAGLWDQQLALAWVRDNIAQFGGDPGRVTLAGQSAGSFSATLHLFSPASRGLFRGLVGQSGPGGFSPSYHPYTGEQATSPTWSYAHFIGTPSL